MEEESVSIGEKYVDPRATPLKFHKFIWYVCLPVGLLFSVKNLMLYMKLLTYPEYLLPLMPSFLIACVSVGLSTGALIGFFHWKPYAWYCMMISVGLSIVMAAISLVITEYTDIYMVANRVGRIIGACLVGIPELIYYYKRRRLFFQNGTPWENG